MQEPKLSLGPELVKLIAEIDEFKGRWEALKALSRDPLRALHRVATVESIGSSTRIEGAKLSDAEVSDLLSRTLSIQACSTRDEQEVAGYAEAMDLVFEAWADLRLTESHIRQLHQVLLRRTQTTLKHAPDWEPWIGFFLRSLKRQKDNLAARLGELVESGRIRRYGKARATWYSLP
ncbi:MAG: hypothetical protein JSS24_15985 [Proteobacteria bacterium]|nr:hypothetical protein [Pseudomonadota bacterium]